MDEQQLHKVRFGTSFIAPLDQSGGSTPNGKPGNHTHRPVVRPGHTASDAWSEDLADHDAAHRYRSDVPTNDRIDMERVGAAKPQACTITPQNVIKR